jgi:hypothetical protein
MFKYLLFITVCASLLAAFKSMILCSKENSALHLNAQKHAARKIEVNFYYDSLPIFMT